MAKFCYQSTPKTSDIDEIRVWVKPWCHSHGSHGYGCGFQIPNPRPHRDPLPWCHGFLRCSDVTIKYTTFHNFFPTLFSFFINFSYFHVIQLSKKGNFDGSWFAGEVNLNYLNRYCTDLDDFVCVGTAWTRRTGRYKTFNKTHKFWARNCRKMVILMVYDCWLSKS